MSLHLCVLIIVNMEKTKKRVFRPTEPETKESAGKKQARKRKGILKRRDF